MVSKNQLKQITKLRHKKYRTKLGYFVAEGEKIVNDLINSSWHAHSLYSLEDNFHPKAIRIDFSLMKQISHLKTPSPVLGVFKIPSEKTTRPSELTIAIDRLIIKLSSIFWFSNIFKSILIFPNFKQYTHY